MISIVNSCVYPRKCSWEKNTKLYIDNTKYISDDLDSDMYDLIDKKLENRKEDIGVDFDEQ